MHTFPSRRFALATSALAIMSLPALAALPQAPGYIDDSTAVPAAKTRILPPMFEQTLTSTRFLGGADNPLATVAEASDFHKTSNYTQTVEYMKKLAAASNGAIKLTWMPEKSAEGYDMMLAVASTSADKSPEGLKKSGKPTVLVEAEIHPGEANGKDAMFMLLRDMTTGKKPLASILDKVNILFIPTVNVDGDMRTSAYGRINQNGPDITGWRVNGQNLNLNRDFTKLDSAEIRNVAWVFNQYDLSFFADTHSTDGAMYPYDSSYCNNGEGWSPAATRWMDTVMQPHVYKEVQSYGHQIHECISLNDNKDLTQGYYPYRTDLARFSNQYGDIRSVPSVLIEQHALHPYKTQVLGNYVMLKAMFESVGNNAGSLKTAIAADRSKALSDDKVTLTWKPGTPEESPVHRRRLHLRDVADHRPENHQVDQQAEDDDRTGHRQRRAGPDRHPAGRVHRAGAVERRDQAAARARHPDEDPGQADAGRSDPVPDGQRQARRRLRARPGSEEPDPRL